MSEECKKYHGRLRDLCLGCGQDGRRCPPQKAVTAFRRAENLSPILICETEDPISSPVKPFVSDKKQSDIGTRLSEMFKTSWGAIPCGNCKADIAKLNFETAEEVQDKREYWIKKITRNAKAAAPKYWQRLAITANEFLHVGGVEYLIGKYLDEACEAEGAANAAVKPG